MSGILDLLSSAAGKQIIDGISKETQVSEGQTSNLLGMAMPLLTGAMQRNAGTASGSESLLGALKGKHDGSILDNLGDLFQGGYTSNVLQDGNGILSHVLGNKRASVEQALSKQSGVDSGIVGKILKMAAPILMGYLGKQSRTQNINAGGIGSLLGNLMGGQSQKEQGLISSLLDADGDGNIIDDIAGMALGKKGKNDSDSGGGLLGSLFGK